MGATTTLTNEARQNPNSDMAKNEVIDVRKISFACYDQVLF